MNNMVLVSAVGFLGMTAVGVGTWYYLGSEERAAQTAAVAAKEEKAERYKREEEIHRLALISYVYPVRNGRRRSSVPVMVKMSIAGSDGMKAVCARFPHVREAVLRTFSPREQEPVGGRRRIDLAGYDTQLQQAINAAVGMPVVRDVDTVMVNAGAGGTGLRDSERKCEAALTG